MVPRPTEITLTDGVTSETVRRAEYVRGVGRELFTGNAFVDGVHPDEGPEDEFLWVIQYQPSASLPTPTGMEHFVAEGDNWARDAYLERSEITIRIPAEESFSVSGRVSGYRDAPDSEPRLGSLAKITAQVPQKWRELFEAESDAEVQDDEVATDGGER